MTDHAGSTESAPAACPAGGRILAVIVLVLAWAISNGRAQSPTAARNPEDNEAGHSRHLNEEVGSTIPLPVPIDSDGKFPDLLNQGASLVNARSGTQRMLLVNMREVDAPPMMDPASETPGVFPTRYAQLAAMGDELRAWIATVSGGQFDLKIDIVDLPVPPPPDGKPWPGAQGKVLCQALLPGIGVNIADYQYVYSCNKGVRRSIMNSMQNGDVGDGRLGAVRFGGTESGINFHEFGHNLGFLHAHALLNGISIGNYPNDFTMKSYRPDPSSESGYSLTCDDNFQDASLRTRVTTSPNAPITPLPIGSIFMDYGSVLDVMGANSWGKAQYSPFEKFHAGWLTAANFADLNALNPSGATNVYKLYDDTTLAAVTKGAGADRQYGVARGYGAVFYGANLVRPAEFFRVSATGRDKAMEYHGEWKLYRQKLNLHYRGAETNVGPFGRHYLNRRIQVEIQSDEFESGIYLGSLQVGQTVREKDLDEHIFAWGSRDNHPSGAQNLEDGTEVRDAPRDFLSYHPGPCKNIDRLRPTWYRLTFLGTGRDEEGEYANLEVVTESGESKH